MPAVASTGMAVGPWAVVAIVALVLLFLAFVVWEVRSAKTNMLVRLGWKGFEIQRGEPDPPTAEPAPSQRLRSVDGRQPEPDPSMHSGEDHHAVATGQ